MNCVTHPAAPATAYCRICGRAMCVDCKHEVQGTIYCEACLAREMHAPAPGVPTPPALSPTGPLPGLAFGLGFIPGVGAIYNGQYAKGFVHIVIFGVLVSIVDNPAIHPFEALFGIMIPAFIIYMAFEASHTARKRLMGEPVDEWSGLFATYGDSSSGEASASVIGPRSGGALVLIALGIILLLSNLGYVSLGQILRWWPLLLIGIGASMLINRMGSGSGPRDSGPQGGI
jgi:hypothetical protein